MKRNATILRPATADVFGDVTGPPTEILDRHPWVVGVSSNGDLTDGERNGETRTVTAYVVGATTQAVGSDLVRIDGFVWQVDGDPVRAESPFSGRLAGYTVRLKQYLG